MNVFIRIERVLADDKPFTLFLGITLSMSAVLIGAMLVRLHEMGALA